MKNVGKCSCFYAVIPIDLDGSVGHHICGSLIHICTYINVVFGTSSHYTIASILYVPWLLYDTSQCSTVFIFRI